ncbi:MAG: PilZ domain-containing protein, partial [Pseudobdellovibrionaceae bacterium]
YHARAPRYILQPQDNTLIRVAGPQQIPWEEGTEIKNISLSGLAFTAPTELCPIVGEFIKIQFNVPATSQMACFGLVTRLEALGQTEMLVGIQFYKLEMSHRIVLLQGLAQKLKDQQKKNSDLHTPDFSWKKLRRNWKVVLAMLFCLCGWLALVQWAWTLK